MQQEGTIGKYAHILLMVNSLVQSIKEKTIKSITLLVAREFLMKVCAMLGQFFLVRILAPDIFGIFAILSFIVGTAEMFTDLGLSLLIIQNKREPSKNEIASIFTVKFLLTCTVFIILFFVAPYFQYIYHGFTLDDITMLRVFSLTLIAKPIRTISLSLLERALRYREIAQIDISGMVTYYAVAIFFAVQNQGLKSFIIAVVVKEIVEVTMAFSLSRFVPRISLHVHFLKDLLYKGMYLQLGTILGFIDRSTIPVIAGLKTTSYNVGFLDWSANVTSIPLLLADNVGRVSFASFAKIQEDRDLIAKAIEKAFSLLSVFTIGSIVVTLVFGEMVIHYAITDKWLPALPALCWFMAGTFFLNGTSVLGHAIMAAGETKKLFFISLLSITFEWIISFFLFIQFGFSGVAVGSCLGSIEMFFAFIILCKTIAIPLHLGKMIQLKVLIFSIALIFALVINNLFPQTVYFLIIKLVLFGLIYTGIYYQFAKTDVIELFLLLKKTVFTI